MLILGIDPGPQTHGAAIYDSERRRVVWSDKAIASDELLRTVSEFQRTDRWLDAVVIERPAAMGTLGPGIVGHMLDTSWEGGHLSAVLQECLHEVVHTMTRRQVLRSLGVLSGKGSPDSKVRAACIADHTVPGGPPAVGKKASPGPLYGVSSHAWQALGLILAWLEVEQNNGDTND